MHGTDYILRGGVEGRERLRLLARVMRPTTLGLLDRVGVRPGMACLDVGCGGGDVAFELARLVGATGSVVGVDIDETKLELARRDAEEQHLGNVVFRTLAVADSTHATEFDLVYTRFLLSHLQDAAGAVRKMQHALRPEGILVVEDIDFRGHFCHPNCPALGRYVELYTEAVRRRGGDPNIGPRLPGMLADAGFERVQMNVVQPAGREGEVKLVTPITMENIADSVLAVGLASRAEVDRVIAALYDHARDPGTVMSLPRVVQAWGYRPHEPRP
jgi:ubiquinone/menaquinone biosynthesis C-methylase UbiE